jgi:ribose/xylose/arabinose/galactoside ABC-type transport system permease subunit
MTVPANPQGAVSLVPEDTAGAAPDEHTKDSLGIRALIFTRDRGIVVLWVVLIIVFSIWASPFFAKWSNAVLIANAAALTATFAAGVAVGVMSGSLDISIPGTAALAGVVCGKLLVLNNPVWVGIVVALAIGPVVGVINGLVTLRGFNPIIVTIGTLSVTSGLAAVVAGGYTIPGLTQLTFMGTRHYAGIPAPVWIVAVLFIVLTVFLTQTRDGIRLMSVGGNTEAVRRSGIHSNSYRVVGFVISGFCAALGGLVSTAVVTSASPTADPGIIFTALTAVALAGVALTGGRGSLPRVLVGALILATISNALTIKGIQPYWGTVVTGLLLLVSLGVEKGVEASVERRLMAAAQATVHSGKK